jgi:hypothetical protein
VTVPWFLIVTMAVTGVARAVMVVTVAAPAVMVIAVGVSVPAAAQFE